MAVSSERIISVSFVFPSKKEFENLGWKFKKVRPGLSYAKMPEGWQLDTLNWTFRDNTGAVRAHTSVSNRRLYLERRYEIIEMMFVPRNTKCLYHEHFPDTEVLVVDNATGRVLYNSGMMFTFNVFAEVLLKHRCKKFLDAKFPKWRNPCSYWD